MALPGISWILVVDGDTAARETLKTILTEHKYKVVICNSATEAYELLERNNHIYNIDMVMIDVNTDDDFQFICNVSHRFHIPIIMMSANGGTRNVMKGIECNACHFILKPIISKNVRFIWQHVYRKRQIDGEDDEESLYDVKKRKQRFIWTVEREDKFMKAVEQIEREEGPKKVGPKGILELMKKSGLTSSHVASHLQKHRQRVKVRQVILDTGNSTQEPVNAPVASLLTTQQQIHLDGPFLSEDLDAIIHINPPPSLPEIIDFNN